VRRLIAKALRTVLPDRWIRVLRDPLLLPGYYRRFAAEIERAIDAVRRGEGLDDDYWAAVVRKNAHIVDKGLARRDFERGHSEAYYQQALAALGMLSEERIGSDPSLVWARAKLDQYQSCQQGCDDALPASPEEMSPGAEAALLEVIRGRRSVRCYADRPVDERTIRRVVEVVNWAPSSCNRQTARVFATTDPALVATCKSTCAGATSFSAPIPVFLAFCADLRPYALPEEMWLPMIDVSLGVQNCCLYAQTLGLSITILSWAQSTPDDERKLRQALDIPPQFRIVLNALMGYYDRTAQTPARKPADATCVLVPRPG